MMFLVSPILPPATAFDMQLGFGVGVGFRGCIYSKPEQAVVVVNTNLSFA